MTKGNFLFYESFAEMFELMPTDADKVEFIRALYQYGIYKQEVETSPLVAVALAGAKPNIDAANRRYEANVENGKKGGRPKKSETQQNPTEPTETQLNPNEPNFNETNPSEPTSNHNDNDNVNANVDVDVEDNADADAEVKYATEITDIVSYLNEKATTKYRPNTPITQKFIRGRLNQGYTVADFRYVIDVKCAEWLGTEWEKYLRPDTLFREGNFEKYLQQKMTTKSPANQERKEPSSFTNIPQDNNYSYENSRPARQKQQGCWNMTY